MKRIGFVNAVILAFLLLGTTAFAWAQEDKPEDKSKREKQSETAKQQKQKPAQSQQQRQTDKNRQQQEQQRPALPQEQKDRQQEQQLHAQLPIRAAITNHVQIQRSQDEERTQQGQQREAWRQHLAVDFDSQHRTWQQRGGYNGYRVPDLYFREQFGQDHLFRIYSLPFKVEGGYPRFQCGGYWFSFYDAYPEYWGSDWYQTDDVYVDYSEDGYYLFNRRFPGRPGIAVSISM